MAVDASTALESAVDEEPTGIDGMFEDSEDVLIPEDMKRFIREQMQHSAGGGGNAGRGQ